MSRNLSFVRWRERTPLRPLLTLAFPLPALHEAEIGGVLSTGTYGRRGDSGSPLFDSLLERASRRGPKPGTRAAKRRARSGVYRFFVRFEFENALAWRLRSKDGARLRGDGIDENPLTMKTGVDARDPARLWLEYFPGSTIDADGNIVVSAEGDGDVDESLSASDFLAATITRTLRAGGQ